MSKHLFYLRLLVVSWAILRCRTAVHADSCTKFYKRAPVNVCGHVFNPLGEKLNNVELTLADEAGSVLFATRSDGKGFFAFGPIAKGEYTIRAKLQPYIQVHRDIRVTRDNDQKCSPKIEIQLGTSLCTSGTRIKGVDKPSDL